MKILICSGCFETKSVGAAHFPNYALKINQLYPNHDVKILTTDTKQSYDKVIKLKTKSYYIPKAFNFIKLNFAFYRHIKKIISTEALDLIVVNHPLNAILVGLRLSNKIKIGVVVHDDYSAPISHIKNFSFRHRIVYGIKKYLEQIILKKFDVILCPSNYIKKYLEPFVNDSTKVELLYQAIDVKKIVFSNPQPINPTSIKILFVKTSYVRGGLFDLIDAIAILKNYNFQLTIVGDMKNVDTEIINDAASNISNVNFVFKYFQEEAYISKLMYENDILCVPSREEVLGLANVEGLAHGIRVVSTKVGGIPEVLDSGKNGWLAEPNNPISLAQVLENCIEEGPSVFEAKSEVGRRFVEEHFDYRSMISRFVEISENVINK